jgi:hypothetical protein
LRSLIKGVLELAKEPSRLCVDEVHMCFGVYNCFYSILDVHFCFVNFCKFWAYVFALLVFLACNSLFRSKEALFGSDFLIKT